jgi:competence protein ComEC
MTYLNRARQVFFVFLCVFFMAACTAQSPSSPRPNSKQAPADSGSTVLEVHYLDVGQGDSTLVRFPGGFTMLIDGGNNAAGPTVVEDIHRLGIARLDAVVATHPDADHIGGLDDVLRAFEVKSFYMPRKSHTTKTFQDLLDAVAQEGLKIKEAKAGVVIPGGDGTKTYFIAPVKTYDDNNNMSAVIKLAYREKTFLFMGDAEKKSEADILKEGEDVQADVLKLGHHGSRSSTSSAFLARVHPQYAIVSAGKNNDYGHPHAEVVQRVKQQGIKLLRTDQLGSIVVKTDGHTLMFP